MVDKTLTKSIHTLVYIGSGDTIGDESLVDFDPISMVGDNAIYKYSILLLDTYLIKNHKGSESQWQHVSVYWSVLFYNIHQPANFIESRMPFTGNTGAKFGLFWFEINY